MVRELRLLANRSFKLKHYCLVFVVTFCSQEMFITLKNTKIKKRKESRVMSTALLQLHRITLAVTNQYCSGKIVVSVNPST